MKNIVVRLSRSAQMLALALVFGCTTTYKPGEPIAPASFVAPSVDSLTMNELAEILEIHAWHVPSEPSGREWTIDAVPAGAALGSVRLAHGRSLIAVRALTDNAYRFLLAHRDGNSSGTFTPCAEPDTLPSICEGYTIEFNNPPICVADCSRAVVAALKPMVGGGGERWIVIALIESLTIRPDANTTLTPLPE